MKYVSLTYFQLPSILLFFHFGFMLFLELADLLNESMPDLETEEADRKKDLPLKASLVNGNIFLERKNQLFLHFSE